MDQRRGLRRDGETQGARAVKVCNARYPRWCRVPAQTSKTFREPRAGATSASTVAKGATLAGAIRSRACMEATTGMKSPNLQAKRRSGFRAVINLFITFTIQ